MKAVIGRLSGARGTCQYPFAKSIVDMNRASRNLLRVASTCSKGYASLLVTWLTRRKSIQNRRFPFFFRTSTTGELHGLQEGSIMPSANILLTSSSIIFLHGRVAVRVSLLERCGVIYIDGVLGEVSGAS